MRILVGCLVPILLITTAACSKPDDGKGVASADGGSAPTATASLSPLDQMIAYTRCMREHGVPMADPEVDGDIVRPGHIDKGAAGDKLFPAEEVCKRYRPAQQAGTEMDLKIELALRLARCMRANGVENFPDPGPDGTRISAEVGSDPDFITAREICEAQADAQWASRAPTPQATR